MSTATQTRRKPSITVSAADHARLVNMATAALDRAPEVAEELLAEMDRAKVVAGTAVPKGIVGMGSTVLYTADQGTERRVTLVYPEAADIAAGRISVFTPVGAALIGLSEGQSMSWTARDGRVHRLTVKSVEPPAAPV